MFGLYVHIPYCLQRCSYCDFATYVYDQIMPPEKYVELLKQELRHRRSLIPDQPLTSIYFGGGTPSLLPPNLILSLLAELEKLGVRQDSQTEITLEINPATLNVDQIEQLIAGGVNRFSVGAQTFNDAHLKAAGRKHNRSDTLRTLDLLRTKNVNYSFDLLFALPQQSLEDIEVDLQIIKEYSPPHLSAYCLTVPQGHPMSFQRAADEEQVQMFHRIEGSLRTHNLLRYEISNFAVPGFESKHNLLYWKDGEYLGLGLSAHSYLKKAGPWGSRFWNPSGIAEYKKHIEDLEEALDPLDAFRTRQLLEELSQDQSRFDFAHTALRLEEGLDKASLLQKFQGNLDALFQALTRLEQKGLVEQTPFAWKLTAQGRLLSNSVFSELFV